MKNGERYPYVETSLMPNIYDFCKVIKEKIDQERKAALKREFLLLVRINEMEVLKHEQI